MGAHAHAMGPMQAGGGHPMAGPGGPNMMQAIHPGVSAPQVAQVPMVTGMPPSSAAPAPGGPMQNQMTMGPLGPQQQIFPQQANQMFNGAMTPQQHQIPAQMKLNGVHMNPQAQMQMQTHQNAQQPLVTIPKEHMFPNQKENAILQLTLFQNSLANPSNGQELSCWDAIVRKFFSPFGTLRHQFVRPDAGQDNKTFIRPDDGKEYKTFLLHYSSLARYLHAHFLSGITQILLQSYDHPKVSGQSSEILVSCPKASLTYVFDNDVRVSTQGALTASFDETNKITRLEIAARAWEEYLPRSVLTPTSPKDSKVKVTKKNQAQAGANLIPHLVPVKSVGAFGVPQKIWSWLEVIEVMNSMSPLIDYCNSHNGIGPREGMIRIAQEQAQNIAHANQALRLQNQIARQANGQIAFVPGMAMNGPNQFASPAAVHLGLPQAQGSPHHPSSVHTPSPGQNPAGGVPMVPQMSAQGSLSGSQGASTNTSPNVSNKRRRASQIKAEEEGAAQGGDTVTKVKGSPRIVKRQKGA
ncbi:hypothetical protein DV737_g4298, partial [Chaetothyriales sp. CBS 132003]